MHYNIKKQNFKYYAYILFIIMLCNGLLFNFIFAGFPIWRQLIWFFGITIFITFINLSRRVSTEIRKVFLHFKVSLLILFLYSLFAIFIKEYNIMRILYAWVLYLFGYSFFSLPFIVVNLKKTLIFFKTLSWLGVIISVGLIIDGIDNNIFFFLKAYASDVNIEDFTINRASFLSESPTIIGLSQLLFFICTLYVSYVSKRWSGKSLYFLFSILFIVGAWFSGARQVFFILLATQFLYLIYCSYKNTSRILLFCVILCPFLYIFFQVVKIDLQSDEISKYSERYTSDTDGGNATRKIAWKEGMGQISFNNPYVFTGHGISYTMGQQALATEEVGYHMESTIWAIFSEGSIFLWYVFLWPWYYAVKLCLKLRPSLIKLLLFCYLASYIFTAFISPNSTHPLASMSLFIVLGLLISFKQKDESLSKIKNYAK